MKKEKNTAWFSIFTGALVGALSAGLAWLCGWLRCYDDEVKKNDNVEEPFEFDKFDPE